jgi:hypothetical protein
MSISFLPSFSGHLIGGALAEVVALVLVTSGLPLGISLGLHGGLLLAVVVAPPTMARVKLLGTARP